MTRVFGDPQLRTTDMQTVEQDRMAYSVKEVSELTGLPISTLKLHIYNGMLKATKVGKRWIINSHSLREYLGYEDILRP
jgi:excisionase family DNA binding protein